MYQFSLMYAHTKFNTIILLTEKRTGVVRCRATGGSVALVAKHKSLQTTDYGGRAWLTR